MAIPHPQPDDLDLPAAEPRPPGRPSRAEWLALAAILALSAALALVNLGQQGFGNPYYAATVRSMLLDPRNFFFASFDPAGWVSVDKPPLGFWIQTAFAAVFGYNGISLLLPQALATVGSCAMAWVIARRAFGPAAGLIAALALALTPIPVAAGRTNTIDPLLVFTLMLCGWALLRAIERGGLGWLLASAALIGLGFNIKMLQAWMIGPAWGFAWLAASPWRLDRRVAAVAAAGALALVVSFSWMFAVEDTPASERPYVGSSATNSAFDLAFGYNGLQRLLPPSLTGVEEPDAAGGKPPSPGAILTTFGAVETGERGPLRLFNQYLAGQIAWLLPLAAVGGIAAWFRKPGLYARPVSRARAALLFFGGWLLTAWVFFSVANQFHRYYLVMLGPPVAVLCGAGLTAMWADWRGPGRRGWLLPLAVAGTGLLAAWIAAPFGDPVRAVGWCAAAAALAAAGLLAATRGRSQGSGDAALARLAATAGLAAMLAQPALWSAWSVAVPVSNTLPAAGPNGDLFALVFAGTPGADQGGGASSGFDRYEPPDPALISYLERNHRGERFMLATGSATGAAPPIIDRAMPVAALGGFIGQDPIVTPRGLARMIAEGEVRFVLAPDPRRINVLSAMTGALGALRGAGGEGEGNDDDAGGSGQAAGLPDPSRLLRLFLTPNIRWVGENCAPVPPGEWQTPGRPAANPLAALDTLYDCGALRR